MNVYFNGELVGHTAEMYHGPVLDWAHPNSSIGGGGGGDRRTSSAVHATSPVGVASTTAAAAGGQVVALKVPRGQLLSACRLELELIAAEHHPHAAAILTTSSYTVLGARTITGQDLEELLAASKTASPAAKTSASQRKVSMTAPSSDTYFNLQVSMRPTVAPVVKSAAAHTTAPDGPEATPTKNPSAKSEKVSAKQRGLDAAGMAASTASAAAANLAAPTTFLTPQGEVGITLRRSFASSDGSTDGAVVEAGAGQGGLKTIIIEEPELIRENSTLQVDLQTIQGLTRSIMHSKSRTTADLSATSDTSAASSTPEVVDVFVRWNGIQVERFFALADMKTGSVQWPQSPSLNLRLPLNLAIQDCHLELLLRHEETYIGSAVFCGEALASLCGAPVVANEDNEEEENQQGSTRSAPGAPVEQLPSDQKNIITVGEPTWRSLTSSTFVPAALQVPVISGRVLLKATLTCPICQKLSASNTGRKLSRRKSLYRTIATDLPAEKKHWEYFFARSRHSGAAAGYEDDEFDADGDDLPGHQKRRGSSKFSPSPGMQGFRKRLASEVSKQSSNDDEGAEVGVAVKNNNLAATSGGTKVQQLQLELAAVSFTVTVHQEIDDYRTCWRGRVMPKNFVASEGTKKAMMVGRASRLVRTHGILDMQVMAEIHQMSDVGDEAEEVNDLPICVKEILSEGPDLVLRTYRVEISANNGVMMGSADVKDNERDIARCIGEQWVPQLLPRERKLWKLGTIFQHIVRERVVLDMLMGKGRGQEGKDGRREGIMQHHEQMSELSGSIITIIRDPSAEDIAKAARLVAEEAEQKEAAEAAAAAQAAAAPTSSGFGLNLNFKGFGFGFGSKAATTTANSSVPAGAPLPVLEEDEMEVENVNTNETQHNSTRGSYSTHTASVDGDALRQAESHKTGRQWCRIHARTHRVVGMPLRSVVLLLTTPRTDALYFENMERFFRTVHGRHCLLQFDVLFRCKNSFTKETREFYITAAELDEWLPQNFTVDLTKKFRRDKFGAYLLQYLSVRFTEDGQVELYLIKENVNVSSSIDDLIAEDELLQQQASEELKEE